MQTLLPYYNKSNQQGVSLLQMYYKSISKSASCSIRFAANARKSGNCDCEKMEFREAFAIFFIALIHSLILSELLMQA